MAEFTLPIPDAHVSPEALLAYLQDRLSQVRSNETQLAREEELLINEIEEEKMRLAVYRANAKTKQNYLGSLKRILSALGTPGFVSECLQHAATDTWELIHDLIKVVVLKYFVHPADFVQVMDKFVAVVRSKKFCGGYVKGATIAMRLTLLEVVFKAKHTNCACPPETLKTKLKVKKKLTVEGQEFSL